MYEMYETSERRRKVGQIRLSGLNDTIVVAMLITGMTYLEGSCRRNFTCAGGRTAGDVPESERGRGHKGTRVV
eukprot:scaffold305428_cov30-Prasinocladus_malaysianus.AAC.1